MVVQAPDIAPTSTDKTVKDPAAGTAPTAFPNALVNIVNPGELPAPTGLNSAFGTLNALGAFRDPTGAVICCLLCL